MSAHQRRKFNFTSTEPIVSIDKSMVTPAQAAKDLVRLQLLCESHTAAAARSLRVCARQHTWNQILPSSPGTVPLMAVKSPFLRASQAVSILSCSNFSPSLAGHGTPVSFCGPCSCTFQWRLQKSFSNLTAHPHSEKFISSDSTELQRF